jgi:hypothetical protein
MGKNIVINGQSQQDGIAYEEIEVLEMNLGGGVDDLTVVNTSYALHMLDLSEGNDKVLVKDIAGPLLIHGQKGSGTVTVQSDEQKLDRIGALFGFDGGTEDEGLDQLVINNIGDTDTDDILNVTRFIVKVESMKVTHASMMMPAVSYLLNFRRATGDCLH